MMRLRSMIAVCVIAAAAAVAPAAAAEAAAAVETGVGFRGWGPRFGASADADQVVVGAQFDLGEFTRTCDGSRASSWGSATTSSRSTETSWWPTTSP